jgi:hypothetical protein
MENNKLTEENGHDKYLRLKNGKIWASSKERIESLGYTITDSPKVFMKYVAQKTGKEYKAQMRWDETSITDDDVAILIGEPDKLYPHKTYRILDSLDGIPLDTRIPLSEWIPPCKSEVLFISKDRKLLGEFVRIDFEGVIVRDKPGFHFTIPDGHWMRIV